MSEEEAAYHELTAYTIETADARFIHQHVVDAYGAQAATDSRSIRLIFSLVGLYMHLERGKTGREVQLMHMQIGKRKREWPAMTLPKDRGALTAIDVMKATPGPERDCAINKWCESVWHAFQGQRDVIIALLAEYGIR
jgi:hypothetical protein